MPAKACQKHIKDIGILTFDKDDKIQTKFQTRTATALSYQQRDTSKIVDFPTLTDTYR